MSQSFSETLREENRAGWDRAVGHRFVDELIDGTIADRRIALYLIQDYRFLDEFLTLLGGAIVAADRLEARLSFARYAGEVAGDEDDYFQRSFAALGVTDAEREETPDSKAATGFRSLMREAAESGSYPAVLAVLVVAEWLYADWASRAEGTPAPASFVHREWIELHSGEDFAARVGYLRSELDRVRPGDEETAREFFRRAVALEGEFFDSAYA